MKKFTAIIISAIVLLSACVFGGCSDFSFNPIGGWIFTDEYLFVDGKELGHINQQEMQYKETKYTFEKSGTGYITVDGSVFKGEMQGEPIRAKVIRVTDTKNSNITGESGMDSIYFSAVGKCAACIGKVYIIPVASGVKRVCHFFLVHGKIGTERTDRNGSA